MSDCEFIPTCPFFNDKLESKPAEAAALKIKYCRTNNLNCALYMVALALGKEKMPPDLYPNEKDRAFMVIAAG